VNDRDKRTIKHIVDKEPFQSAIKISEVAKTTLEKDVHPETIRRTIKEFGFGSYIYTMQEAARVKKKIVFRDLNSLKPTKIIPLSSGEMLFSLTSLNIVYLDQMAVLRFGGDLEMPISQNIRLKP